MATTHFTDRQTPIVASWLNEVDDSTYEGKAYDTSSLSLYVSPSGNNANSGLTAAAPVQTIAKVFELLETFNSYKNGSVVINLAAGTYSGANTFPENFRGAERTVIQGPTVGHPNVPTAIIDGSGTAAFGLNFNGNNKVSISNIKVTNCTSYGIVAQDLCDISCTNVHVSAITSGCGVKMQQGRLRLSGGIITTCGTYGVELISGTTFTIGDGATSLATGTQITNCTLTGVLAQENSTGHLDYTTVDNCAVGLDIIGSSRVHALSSDIKNNVTAGVRLRANSHWYNNSSTFTSNGVNELKYNFSLEIGKALDYVANLRSSFDRTLVTHTGTVAATDVKTYSNLIQKNSLTWSGRSVRIRIAGEITNGGSPNTKAIACRLDGNDMFGVVFTAGMSGSYVVDGILYSGSANQQSYSVTGVCNGSSPLADSGARSITTNGGSDQTVTVRATLGNTGDTITVRTVEIWETA